MLPTCSLIPSAFRATISGARLTRMHPHLYSINISRQFNPCAIGYHNILLTKSFSTGSSLLSSSSTSTSAKKGATASASKDASSSRTRSGTQETSPPEENFNISFRDLGMNRITKFVVYTAIGVFSTMETIFWCKVLWRWWVGDEEDT
ncbi:hypothetical protein GGS24DRAFT_449000, partial [Hypoxylon argillaceum]